MFFSGRAEGSESQANGASKPPLKQPSVIPDKTSISADSDEEEDEEDESSDSESSDDGEYFDLRHPTRFWNRVEAGMRTRSYYFH